MDRVAVRSQVATVRQVGKRKGVGPVSRAWVVRRCRSPCCNLSADDQTRAFLFVLKHFVLSAGKTAGGEDVVSHAALTRAVIMWHAGGGKRFGAVEFCRHRLAEDRWASIL